MDINEEYTGYFNKSLTSFTRDEAIEFRDRAFANCKSLSYICTTDNTYTGTTSFGEYCFFGCTALKKVITKDFEIPSIYVVDDSMTPTQMSLSGRWRLQERNGSTQVITTSGDFELNIGGE